jgi:hypothetical protein
MIAHSFSSSRQRERPDPPSAPPETMRPSSVTDPTGRRSPGSLLDSPITTTHSGCHRQLVAVVPTVGVLLDRIQTTGVASIHAGDAASAVDDKPK